MKTNTKKLTAVAMLCTISYIVMVIGRIPIVLFLKYDPKDVIITIGGFIFGPLTAFFISVIVSFFEMVTVSGTGIIGCIMNIISSCVFACTASYIYKKNHTLKGAAIGLITAVILTTGVMLLWNYFITPIYMGYPREAVAELLLPAFLPFNLLKGSLNLAFTLLLYKPVITGLRRANLVKTSSNSTYGSKNLGVILFSSLVLVTCIFYVLVIKGII